MRQQTKQQAEKSIDLRREQLAQREKERLLEAERERELAQLEQMRKNVEEKKLQLEAISGNVTPYSLEKQAEQLAELSARFERSPKLKGSDSSSPSTQDNSGRGSAIQNSPGPQKRLLGLAQGLVSHTPEQPQPSPSPSSPSPSSPSPSSPSPSSPSQLRQPEIRTIYRPAATRPPTNNSSIVPTITFTPPASEADYASLNATIARIRAEQEKLNI